MRHRFSLKQLVAGEHLPQHHAEGPDVSPLVRRNAGGLLRSHVGGGAEDDARGCGVGGQRRRHRQAVVAVVGIPRLGQAEVEHLDRTVGTELDVGRLEVAVDDALLVGRLQCLGDLQGDGDGVIDGDRAAFDAIRQVLAVDELHDEERES